MPTCIWVNIGPVISCGLMATSHYLKHCWLISNEVQWHLYESNFIRDALATHQKLSRNIKLIQISHGPTSAVVTVCSLDILLTNPPWTKWSPFWQTTISNAFSWISLKFVPRSLIDNKPVLVQVMAWRRTGDKQLPEPVLTQFTDAYMRHQGEMS